MPPPSSDDSSMTWLVFALLTVAAWGVYGIFLHNGQVMMKDPENGRYKAFLFVGIAYFLTAVVAPIVDPEATGSLGRGEDAVPWSRSQRPQR